MVKSKKDRSVQNIQSSQTLKHHSLIEHLVFPANYLMKCFALPNMRKDSQNNHVLQENKGVMDVRKLPKIGRFFLLKKMKFIVTQVNEIGESCAH